MEEEEFNVAIAVLNVFDESDCEHDNVEESPQCLLSFKDTVRSFNAEKL